MAEQHDVPIFQYKDRLKEVRVLPRKSPEERHRKWEEMRDLKIETMFSYGLLADIFVREVEQNPSISLKELELKAAEYRARLSRPEVINKFLSVFEREAKKTSEALNHFRREASLPGLKNPFNKEDWSAADKQEVAERVFVSITQQKPQSAVDLIITPLGLGIQTNHDGDFNLLDKRQNIGGYYKFSQSFTKNRKVLFLNTPYSSSFPLIVSATKNPQVIKHEIGHAVNRIIMYTISDIVGNGSFDKVWGGIGYFELPKKTINDSKSLLEYMQKSIMPYALSSAKDEILTDFIARGNFKHLEHLIKEGGIYDYFDHAIKFLQESKRLNLSEEEIKDIKSGFWGKYKTEIEDNIKFAEEVTIDYSRNRIHERVRLLPYVLSQVPITKWKTFLGRFLYSETGAIYYSIANAHIEWQKKRVSASNLNQINWFSNFIRRKDAESKNPSTKSIYRIARELDIETDKFSKLTE